MNTRPSGRLLTAVVSAILVLLSSSMRPCASSAGALKLPPVVRTELDNGLVLLVMEDGRLPLVNMKLVVWGGSASDPKGLEGVCALTATLLRKGAGRLSAGDLAEKVESMGGVLESSAGKDFSLISAEFLAKDFQEAMGLLGDVVLRPGFEPQEFQREKSKALGRLEQIPDNPYELADREFDMFMLGDHPYGHPTEGVLSSVRKVKLEDVREYHEFFYRPQRTVLAVVGDVDAAAALDAVQSVFAGWERRGEGRTNPPAPPWPKGRRILLIDKPDATQTQIRIGNTAVSRTDDSYVPLYVANVLFGGGFTSRLIDEIRVNRGLSYSPHSRFYSYASGGTFVIKEYTRNEQAMETIEVTLDLVKTLRETPVPDGELTKTKNYVNGLFPLRLERPESIAAQLVEMELYGLGEDYLARFPEAVEAVTAESLSRAAREYIAFEDFTFTVVGVADLLKEPLSKYGEVQVRKVSPAREEAGR